MFEIIYGQVPSKSNCYRFGNGKVYKAEHLVQYEKDFQKQCVKYRNKNIDTNFGLNVKVFYKDKRSDLDNSLKVILDCLQKCGAIRNDNKCMRIVAYRYIDKVNPRIEYELMIID